jgi:hypothetical protein
MASNEPTAAGQIWPNLPKGERPERAQTGPRLSAAMWPQHNSRNAQPKSPQHSDRDSLLRHLRELNRKIDERMERERRR